MEFLVGTPLPQGFPGLPYLVYDAPMFGYSSMPLCRMVNEKPMSYEALAQFATQQYLNLESYKRNGTPVRTPVWFAEEDGVLYIYTLANA
jgi:hypothetical protein